MTLNNCLVLLLSSEVERRLMVDDPLHFQSKHCITASDMNMLQQLDMAHLERQAHQLITKRQREVAKLIPNTLRFQQPAFYTFAQTYWPVGHKRHVLDD